MKTEKEKFDYLINELNGENKLMYIVLLLGLYGEYIGSELFKLELGFDPKNKNTRIDQYKILQILKEKRFLEDSEFDVLDNLREIRNEYSHNLEINEERIKKIMENIPINWSVENKEKITELENKFKDKQFERFELASLTKIQFLFMKIASKKGQTFLK